MSGIHLKTPDAPWPVVYALDVFIKEKNAGLVPHCCLDAVSNGPSGLITNPQGHNKPLRPIKSPRGLYESPGPFSQPSVISFLVICEVFLSDRSLFKSFLHQLATMNAKWSCGHAMVLRNPWHFVPTAHFFWRFCLNLPNPLLEPFTLAYNPRIWWRYELTIVE